MKQYRRVSKGSCKQSDHPSFDWLIDWLTDWLIDWLIDWLVDRSIDWLIDWLNAGLLANEIVFFSLVGRKKKAKFSVCSSSVTGEDCNREANLSMFAQNIPSVLGDDEGQMSTSSKKSISFHQTVNSIN
jgi:hypothetical protein